MSCLFSLVRHTHTHLLTHPHTHTHVHALIFFLGYFLPRCTCDGKLSTSRLSLSASLTQLLAVDFSHLSSIYYPVPAPLHPPPRSPSLSILFIISPLSVSLFPFLIWIQQQEPPNHKPVKGGESLYRERSETQDIHISTKHQVYSFFLTNMWFIFITYRPIIHQYLPIHPSTRLVHLSCSY